LLRILILCHITSADSIVTEINNRLEKYQQHFVYRVRDEIVFYVIYAVKNDLFSFDQAMDYSIVQKILPKVSGSGGEVLDIYGKIKGIKPSICLNNVVLLVSIL